MARIHNDGSLEDEELVREGGVFVSRNGGHEVDADETRAADDYIEDPGTGDGVPGTVDDLPYDFGLETATRGRPAARELGARARIAARSATRAPTTTPSRRTRAVPRSASCGKSSAASSRSRPTRRRATRA